MPLPMAAAGLAPGSPYSRGSCTGAGKPEEGVSYLSISTGLLFFVSENPGILKIPQTQVVSPLFKAVMTCPSLLSSDAVWIRQMLG